MAFFPLLAATASPQWGRAAAPAIATTPTVVTTTVAALGRERRGLSLSGGLGFGYGGLGVQLRYDVPLRAWLHVAPLVGGGVSLGTATTLVVGAAGISAGLGFRHRVALDGVVAPTVFESLNLHGTVVASHAVYGPNLALGYEHVSDSGNFHRVTVGYGWSLWNTSDRSAPSTWTFNVGFGARLW